MFSAHEGRGRRRFGRTAVSVVAVAAGAASLFLAAPAQAGTPQPPVLHPAAHSGAPSGAELRARVAGALAADSGPSSTTRSAEPTPPGTGGTTHKVTPQIIGGTTTTISSAPWMAQLWYDDPSGDSFFCGGTVVSPSKILTAAHCVAGYDWAANGAIVTGTDQLPTSNADGTANLHGGTVTGVWRQWNNPSYNTPKFDNDVAVLTLDTPVTAKPLPITTAGDSASYVTGTNGTVYGWGRTSSGSQDISQTLKKATLPVVSNSACSAVYGPTFVAGHMVCAGPPASGTDAGTTATCNGDSGGPLVIGGKIVGVVSWGVEDCVEQGTYSVFSRVGAYVGAINPRLDDANLSLDSRADLMAVTSGGAAYEYDSTGSAFAPKAAMGDFSGLNLFRQTDFNRDDYQDLIVRTTSGQLYALDGNTGDAVLIGPGWNSMASIIAPGDITGDGLPDVVATDSSGNSWTYPGNGKGTLGSRIKIGGGWNTYNGQIYGKGDLTGDGRPDIIARDSSGTLWLYKGTGSASAPWAARTKIGPGWNAYNAFAAVGDITGDGKADLVARDSSGNLWLYKGTGSASGPFAAKVKIGPGWNAYKYFG
ncbi:Repeat domain-containing protein [Actinacidiphila alni]|uniref:Repeat domain-containing protein n=1 Tax=Actinacidiphila alni TaxID=380248 RepID=A0A1I2HYA7_9ACTN|nr:trypsin-like serine protease [Actinacidiphila alni]SFF35135.1 Repeat domain-containing protein [Actinacidiphila alni]